MDLNDIYNIIVSIPERIGDAIQVTEQNLGYIIALPVDIISFLVYMFITYMNMAMNLINITSGLISGLVTDNIAIGAAVLSIVTDVMGAIFCSDWMLIIYLQLGLSVLFIIMAAIKRLPVA
jgi:hypothetical protein